MKNMTKTFAALILGAVIATPAFAGMIDKADASQQINHYWEVLNTQGS